MLKVWSRMEVPPKVNHHLIVAWNHSHFLFSNSIFYIVDGWAPMIPNVFMETSCTFVIYVPHSKLYISKDKQGFLIASLDKVKWHLQACNNSSRTAPRIGWKMKINIDVAIPILTDGLVFQILTIWQTINMNIIFLSFCIFFIFLSSLC
jgi:hypothetical protein